MSEEYANLDFLDSTVGTAVEQETLPETQADEPTQAPEQDQEVLENQEEEEQVSTKQVSTKPPAKPAQQTPTIVGKPVKTSTGYTYEDTAKQAQFLHGAARVAQARQQAGQQIHMSSTNGRTVGMVTSNLEDAEDLSLPSSSTKASTLSTTSTGASSSSSAPAATTPAKKEATKEELVALANHAVKKLRAVKPAAQEPAPMDQDSETKATEDADKESEEETKASKKRKKPAKTERPKNPKNMRPGKGIKMAVDTILYLNRSTVPLGKIKKLGAPISRHLDLINCKSESLIEEIKGHDKYQSYMHDVDGTGKVQRDFVWSVDDKEMPIARILSAREVTSAFGVGSLDKAGWAKIDAIHNRDPNGDRVFQNDALWFQHAKLDPQKNQASDFSPAKLKEAQDKRKQAAKSKAQAAASDAEEEEEAGEKKSKKENAKQPKKKKAKKNDSDSEASEGEGKSAKEDKKNKKKKVEEKEKSKTPVEAAAPMDTDSTSSSSSSKGTTESKQSVASTAPTQFDPVPLLKSLHQTFASISEEVRKLERQWAADKNAMKD